MDRKEQIITIAGRRVEVRLCEKGPCDNCCFFSHDCGCPYDMPCFPYWGPGYFAYFVPAKESGEEYCKHNCKGFQETGRCFADGECDAKKAEEIEGTSQEVTLIPSNENADKALPKVIYCGWNGHGNLSYSNTRALPNMRPYVPATNPVDATRLLPCEADKAAEEWAAAHDTGGFDCYGNAESNVYSLIPAFKAGIAYERERLMKEAVEIGVSNVGILQMGSILTDKGIFAGDTIQAIIIKKEK